MIVTKRESMASLVHDTSPVLRHSLQQSHNKGLYYGFRDAILSRLVTIIKCMHVCIFMKHTPHMSYRPWRENYSNVQVLLSRLAGALHITVTVYMGGIGSHVITGQERENM